VKIQEIFPKVKNSFKLLLAGEFIPGSSELWNSPKR